MNVKLLRQVKAAILKRPGQFLMDSFFSSRNSTGRPATGCGTACCIAGWTVALHKRVSPKKARGLVALRKRVLPTKASDLDMPWFTDDAAQKMLRLDYAQARRLFYGDEWPTAFRMAYRDADTAKQAAKAAAARIEHFIRTKGAE